MTTSERVDAACLRGLVRSFGQGPRTGVEAGFERIRRDDASALKFWWALSTGVGKLAARVRERPREIAGVTVADEVVCIGEIPGVLNAAETARAQARTGDPTLFVGEDAFASWLSGPNRLLALTLAEADRALLSHSEALTKAAFSTLAGDRAVLVEECLRIQALREILLTPAGRARITPFERRQAAKARAPLYRLAYEAATLLERLEDLDPAALSLLFSQSLLPSMEIWRRFEMLCVLEVAHALEAVTGAAAVLDVAFSASRPAARVGRYAVWWQRAVPPRPEAALDRGEALARTLASGLGVDEGAGRSDIAVEADGEIVAFVECKWFGTAEQSSGAILDACAQLVRYARDVHHRQGGKSVEELLASSVVALADRGGAPCVRSGGRVGCVDLADIETGALRDWASALVA